MILIIYLIYTEHKGKKPKYEIFSIIFIISVFLNSILLFFVLKLNSYSLSIIKNKNYKYGGFSWKIGIYLLFTSLIFITIISFVAFLKFSFTKGNKNVEDRGDNNTKELKIINKNNENIIDLIKKLKELKDSGIISEEEFEQKKKELLDKL